MGEDHEAGIEAAKNDKVLRGRFGSHSQGIPPLDWTVERVVAAYLSRCSSPCPDCQGGTLRPMHVEPEGYCLTCGTRFDDAPSPERHARGQRGYVADCRGCGSRFKRIDLAERHADFTGHELIRHTASPPECDTERLVEALQGIAATENPVRARRLAREALAEFGGSDAEPPDSRVSREP